MNYELMRFIEDVLPQYAKDTYLLFKDGQVLTTEEKAKLNEILTEVERYKKYMYIRDYVYEYLRII